ncbi:MAG: hypothetical protein PHH84_05665 [Oscillospiraceae bacterium]|nr:hypothetical protein [Oscillospiraceae bacterium]MDD3833023.1 hypothetical protein [Oscillospiraceae bacterium]MDD4545712.1 hypothetical protein [Oscillospiraceae bacterium]
MKIKHFRWLSFVLAAALLFTGCGLGKENSSDISTNSSVKSSQTTTVPTNSSEIIIDTPDISSEEVSGNKEKGKFPLFSNQIDYSKGENIPQEEEYLSYLAMLKFRHEFKDMINHKSEVAAVRLVKLGVFDKTKNFYPDKTLTVIEFFKYLFITAGLDIKNKDDAALIELAKSSKLIEDDDFKDFNHELTNQELAYLVDKAVADRSNTGQFAMMISDFSSVSDKMKRSVLQVVGLGILECNGKFQPKKATTRAVVADALYRLVNTGYRVVLPYELGESYNEDTDILLVKSEYIENPGGIQLGLSSGYNKQDITFDLFGKRPIDRVEFYKWRTIETKKGKYNFGTFYNDLEAHKLGSTVISCVDISANLNWNPDFAMSNIPEFYEQDITNKATRTAAKQFLYSFVQEMMKAVYGDVILSIDYELDWQQRLSGVSEAHRSRAAIFADWYVEACNVAREAAKAVGAADRLKLMVIYNNVTDHHKLGIKENEWMKKLGQASDYIGIDSYQFPQDKSDPSITLQNIRFLINNYSYGKPVMMVENGLVAKWDETEKNKTTGLSTLQEQAKYFQNLFREFQFALERGDFINKNLSGFLIWQLMDTTEVGALGLLDIKGIEKPSVKTVQEGFKSIEKQRQFNPSVLTKVTDATYGADIKVESGTTYEKLTYITRNWNGKENGTFRIKLKNPGTVFITVNGDNHYVIDRMADIHEIPIKDALKKGNNVIDIYFGSEKTPFEQSVLKVLLH